MTRILILGGGFGGVHTAMGLERRLARELRAGTVEIGLVSRENYMVFQPMLPYDHLVIALGNVTSFAGQAGLAEHALPFKYLGDALAIRNRVIHTLEEA